MQPNPALRPRTAGAPSPYYQTLRCSVCGGTDSKSVAAYPDERYCTRCGAHMSPYDYNAYRELFAAMGNLRFARDLLEINGFEGFKRAAKNDSLPAAIHDLFTNVLDAYDRFRGSEFKKRKRKRRSEKNIDRMDTACKLGTATLERSHQPIMQTSKKERVL